MPWSCPGAAPSVWMRLREWSVIWRNAASALPHRPPSSPSSPQPSFTTWGWEIRPVYVPAVAWTGLIDILLLGAVLLLSRGVGRWTGRSVALLWLVILAGVWYGLRIPVASPLTYSAWPAWLSWGLWIQTTWSWSLLGTMLIWVWLDWRAQARAWPNDLGCLVRRSKPWPGLEVSVRALGLALVPIGLWHAFSTGAEAWQVARLTTWDMAAAALALSIFIAWRWSPSVAELALALWTVSLAAFGATTAQQVAGPAGTAASIDRLPVVHSGALLGLAGASLLWFWLRGLWRGQLRNGRAWTTAGRLTHLADRMGFLSAALAVLVGAKLALWPRLPYGAADNSPGRLWASSLIFLLLVGACLYAAKQTRRPTLLGLAGMAGVLWGVFLWLRIG